MSTGKEGLWVGGKTVVESWIFLLELPFIEILVMN
jgi:hypothetical protein